MATPVSLALVARWCFTGASRETPALISDLVTLPSCRCCSWPSGPAGGAGRLHGGDQTVGGLGFSSEGIAGCIAPRVDRLVTDRAVSIERSIHGGQCATRIGTQAPADLAGSVPLGRTSNHAAAKDLVTIQQALLRTTPGRAGRLPGLLGPILPVRARMAGDPQDQASDDTPCPSSKQHHRYTKLLTPYGAANGYLMEGPDH